MLILLTHFAAPQSVLFKLPEASQRQSFSDGEGEHLPLGPSAGGEAGAGRPLACSSSDSDPENPIEGLAVPGKKLAKKKVMPIIRERVCAGLGHRLATQEEIDRVNIQCHPSRHGACCGGTEEPGSVRRSEYI